MSKLDEIAALWDQNLSASKIASQLGMTKGTVCGLLFRARLAGDPRFPLRPKPVAFAALPQKDKPVRDFTLSHLAKPPPRSKDERGKLQLVDLREDECRYPVNSSDNRDGHLFCGALKAPMSSYCEKHRIASLSPIVLKKRHMEITT